MEQVLEFLNPATIVSKRNLVIIVFAEMILALFLWTTWPSPVVPRPTAIVFALQTLWLRDGLGPELFSSFGTTCKALFISSIFSMSFAYMSIVPLIKPVSFAVSKARFLSIVGFQFLFTVLIGGGAILKVSLLVFGVTVFMTTSMIDVVAAVPKEKLDDARTLKMGPWQTMYEVVILGTFHQMLDVIRQNVAIAWMMCPMIEGVVRSEGGVGAMLLNENKHLQLDSVFAIQAVILLVGFGLDYFIGLFRKTVCPYADLAL